MSKFIHLRSRGNDEYMFELFKRWKKNVISSKFHLILAKRPRKFVDICKGLEEMKSSHNFIASENGS